MREGGVTTLYTENEKDFTNISWIKTVNPINTPSEGSETA